MPLGKEFRNQVLALSPLFSYVPDEDRYLFAPGEARYRFNVIGTGRKRAGAHPRDPDGGPRHHPRRIRPQPAQRGRRAAGVRPVWPGGKLVVYDSLEAACNDPAVDGLIICTPNFSHIDVVRVAPNRASTSCSKSRWRRPSATRMRSADRRGSSSRLPDRPAVSLQTDLRRGDPRGAGAQDDRQYQDDHHPGAPLPLPGQGQAVEQVLEILRRHAGGKMLPLFRPDEPVRGRPAGQCIRHRQHGGQLPRFRVRGPEVGHPGQRVRDRDLRERRAGQLQPVHVLADVLRGDGAVRR